MAYEVTATRKRPQVFDTVVGQEFVVSTITNAIAQGRIAHAYLFSGPRGVGKTTSARILAKALNCVHGPTTHPCGECANCREIAAGNSVDVIEIDGASNTSVNDIRQIKDEVLFPPQCGRYKIYIIDEVHMLSISAFNALLKTIEEPPEYIIFIFATTEPQKVPATIRSRCQQFHFQLIGLETIKGCLKSAADELGVEADDEALFWIAREATGSMRDAYTLFDQVVSFSGDHLTMEGIREKLGLVGSDQLNDIILSLLRQDTKSAILKVRDLLSSGVSIEQCVKDLTQYFRALLLLRDGITEEDILGIQSSSISDEVKQAYSKEQLEQAVDMLLKLYRDVRYSLNPRFDLELLISRLGSLPFMVSPTSLVRRLSKLQSDLAGGNLPESSASLAAHLTKMQETLRQKNAEPPEPRQQPMETPAPPLSPAPTQAAPEPLKKRPFTTSDLEALLATFSRDPLMTGVVQDIREATGENPLTLVFSRSFAQRQANLNANKLAQGIREISGYDGEVVFVLKDQDKAEKKEIPQDDEVINTIASLFRGEIINEGK